eukprot:5967157-Alexandrium_andersonii.AAC.1
MFAGDLHRPHPLGVVVRAPLTHCCPSHAAPLSRGHTPLGTHGCPHGGAHAPGAAPTWPHRQLPCSSGV